MKDENKILRTAAYIRVSTRMEEQEGSYDIQKDYFTEKINNNPNMTLVGIYGDYGKTGLKTSTRKGLNRLMEDCREGKIDLILTKSMSRLARNMADCSEMIRNLRELNVNILFEKENINSKDVKCDLLLNIFAALAQEESNSISQNVIRAHEQYASEGRPFGNISYGYYNMGDNRWAIREEEAERVRIAFELASEGKNYQDILAELNQLEEREGTGINWRQRRLRHLLRNVVYIGDYYSNETVCLVPGHQEKNRGYRDRYYIEEHHEPIVSRELFKWVQMVKERKLLLSYRKHTAEDIAFLKGKDEFLRHTA